MTALPYHLSLAYRSRVVDQTDRGRVDKQFRDAIEADQDLRKAAVAKLASLQKISDKRCFISKIHRDFLAENLAKETA